MTRQRPAFTLTELLVVMAIVSVIGTVVIDYMVRAARDNQKLDSLTGVQTRISFALDRVNRIIRSTTAIISADSTSLKILAYANASDTAPSQIYFYLSGTRLLYDVTPASGTAPNYVYNIGDVKTLTLIGKVTNSASVPLFQYYDQTNTLLTGSITIANVHAVSFLPSVLDESGVLTTPTVAETYVTLRNFKTNL